MAPQPRAIASQKTFDGVHDVPAPDPAVISTAGSAASNIGASSARRYSTGNEPTSGAIDNSSNNINSVNGNGLDSSMGGGAYGSSYGAGGRYGSSYGAGGYGSTGYGSGMGTYGGSMYGGGSSYGGYGGGYGSSMYGGGYGGGMYGSRMGGMYGGGGYGMGMEGGGMAAQYSWLHSIQNFTSSLGYLTELLGMNTQAITFFVGNLMNLLESAGAALAGLQPWREFPPGHPRHGEPPPTPEEERRRQSRVRVLRWIASIFFAYAAYRLSKLLRGSRQHPRALTMQRPTVPESALEGIYSIASNNNTNRRTIQQPQPPPRPCGGDDPWSL